MRSLFFALITLFLASTAALASSSLDDITFLLGNRGDWQNGVDPGGGCFMSAEVSNKTIVKFGFYHPSTLKVYAMVAGDQTYSLEAGRQYSVRIAFDDNERWNGYAAAIDIGKGLVGLIITFDSLEVVQAISSKSDMNISGEYFKHIPVRIEGSSKAWAAAQECQASNRNVDYISRDVRRIIPFVSKN